MRHTRREWLGRGVAASFTAASYSRILGANDRVGIGFMGYGLIGAQHVHDFKNQRDTELVAVSDVYQPRLEQGIQACTPGRTRGYADFRKMLDDRDVQAVVVSTPDHWHALATILACAAGKDVYVEKPMTLFVAEGRWMIRAAEKYKRVVQVGTQQRSGRHYQNARALAQSGYFGRIHSAQLGSARNIMPGFGRPNEPIPAGFDYDMWLGPAPARPFSPHRGLYHFRWFWDFSGGQMTNLGAHQLDIVHWYLGLETPRAVSSSGGRFALEDDGETPDTQEAIFEYPHFVATWSHREASAGKRRPVLEFFGTKGSMTVDRGGYEVTPDPQMTDPANAIPTFQGHPSGGPQRAARPDPGKPPKPAEIPKWIEPRHESGSTAEQFDLHARNFLDCVKSRQQPISPVLDGHRVAVACHLANLSLRLGRKLQWDAGREQVIGDPEANAMLLRPYRKPWDEVLRSLSL